MWLSSGRARERGIERGRAEKTRPEFDFSIFPWIIDRIRLINDVYPAAQTQMLKPKICFVFENCSVLKRLSSQHSKFACHFSAHIKCLTKDQKSSTACQSIAIEISSRQLIKSSNNVQKWYCPSIETHALKKNKLHTKLIIIYAVHICCEHTMFVFFGFAQAFDASPFTMELLYYI